MKKISEKTDKEELGKNIERCHKREGVANKSSKDDRWGFRGRVGRKDSSIRFFCAVIVLILGFFFQIYDHFHFTISYIFLFGLYFLIIQTIKKLYGINESGYLIPFVFSFSLALYAYLVSLFPSSEIAIIPVIIPFLVLFFASALILIPALFKKGTKGPNRYGDEPKKQVKKSDSK
ncbi:MAG: hypothetical protein CR982_10260 [Candidatus Cloacimonadota bacterium]|nr:MAG: hypothetical protein CR982_10260 [Candidatus Cloacimonadota bacterium]PIE77543.1 MAG: hypothetical protein CSA15_12265 [Candidatus Delongbacteria bacterium]